ncbi:2057_t:CDS:1, partial [Dentiscutata heterogama]
MENCGIIGNRNLEEWKINREFLIRIARSKKFLRMIAEKSYETVADMFKLWDIMINDKRDIDFSKWLEKFAGDIAISTSTGYLLTQCFLILIRWDMIIISIMFQLQNGNNLRN